MSIARRSLLLAASAAARLPAAPAPVGGVWVLAGQSNMQGAGLLSGSLPGRPEIRVFSLANRWQPAADPLHDWWDAVHPAYWPGGRRTPELAAQRRAHGRTIGAGPGLPFALALYERTRVPIGLLPCALSGTAIAEWSPALPAPSLYTALLDRVRLAGGRVAGVLWYQGEADAKPELAPQYEQRLYDLLTALRRDLAAPALPIHLVQIGRHVHDPDAARNAPAWNQVQEAQRRLEQRLPGVTLTATLDLELDDGIHLGADGAAELGRRLALAALGDGAGPRPSRVVAGDRLIRLELTGVHGRIEPAGRLSGFTVADAAGRVTPRIYRIRPEGSALSLLFDGGPTPPATLSYGQGKDPYANIRDSLGMALPAFGPMPVSIPTLGTG